MILHGLQLPMVNTGFVFLGWITPDMCEMENNRSIGRGHSNINRDPVLITIDKEYSYKDQ